MKCRINGCNETTRRLATKCKCWKIGLCPRHAAKFCPQLYNKKYDPERMPFRKRTRTRSPKIEKGNRQLLQSKPVYGIFKKEAQVCNEKEMT